MQNSLEVLATACVEHVYISTTVKKKQFHAFVEFSVILVHLKYSSEKKEKKELLATFELPSSVIRVLDLAHYTTANDTVILLPLCYIQFQIILFILVYLAKTIDNMFDIKLE